jgi:hypothetical protein
MFQAYNVSQVSFDHNRHVFFSRGKRVLSKFKAKIDEQLERFTDTTTGNLQANLLTAKWFPEIQADIFISHSHQDYNDVVCLAGWLYETFNLTTFVDSCVWGYSDKLLKLIDDEYCSTGESTYNYSLRNYSTSHVHMMLSMALTKMIYNTECLFFYNTPNSITPIDVIESKTLSPWIFTEIGMTSLIQRRDPQEHRNLQKSLLESSYRPFSREDLAVEYEIDTSHLIPLGIDELKLWAKNVASFSVPSNALDFLYETWQ